MAKNQAEKSSNASRASQVESVPVELLASDPKNARNHSERNLEAIKNSLARFGQPKPIVVGSDNVVVAGNGTLEAAKSLGWSAINVVRTELDGDERAAFAIADNRTAEHADWDIDQLVEQLNSFDRDLIESAGFDEAEHEEVAAESSSSSLGSPSASSRNLDQSSKSIRPVLSVDQLDLVERAIQQTGVNNRGEAITEICRSYLGETEGQLDASAENIAEAEDLIGD